MSNLNFRLDRVLSFDQKSKSISLLATSTTDGKPAVILLEKLQFDESKFKPALKLSFDSSNSKVVNSNDIYTHLFYNDPTNTFDINVKIIYPATEVHILKYSKQDKIMVIETPDIYNKITLPFIVENSSQERLQWVYNILDHGGESEKIIYKDDNPNTGFYLTPDTKWDGQNVSSLYLLAICKRKDIRSVRDLSGIHLELLKRMQLEIPQCVEKEFGLSACKLRLFVHYQPSYYHFHVHVLNIDNDSAFGTAVGQAILLNDIIDGIESFGSDFWQRKTISYVLNLNHALYSRLKTLQNN